MAATENLETLQLQPGGLGTQQPSGLAPLQPGSSGTLQVPSGNLGTLQAMAGSPGMLQPSSPGTLQVMAGSPGTQQPEGSGTLQSGPHGLEPPRSLQVGSGVSEMLQPGVGDVEPQLVLQLVPGAQGTLQVGPGGVGTLQALPRGLETLQPVARDGGMLLPVPGDVEPLLVPEGQETLPAELRYLEPLAGSMDVQELLQSLAEGLESGSGTLETLEALELMPDMPEAVDGGLAPGLASECQGWGGQRGGHLGTDLSLSRRQRRAPEPPRPVPAAAGGRSPVPRQLPLRRRFPPTPHRCQRLPVTPPVPPL